MKTIKRIGRMLLVIIVIVSIWLAVSFIDIATKNHVSDKNYKEYSKWNLIVILNDYAISQRS